MRLFASAAASAGAASAIAAAAVTPASTAPAASVAATAAATTAAAAIAAAAVTAAAITARLAASGFVVAILVVVIAVVIIVIVIFVVRIAAYDRDRFDMVDRDADDFLSFYGEHEVVLVGVGDDPLELFRASAVHLHIAVTERLQKRAEAVSPNRTRHGRSRHGLISRLARRRDAFDVLGVHVHDIAVICPNSHVVVLYALQNTFNRIMPATVDLHALADQVH